MDRVVPGEVFENPESFSLAAIRGVFKLGCRPQFLDTLLNIDHLSRRAVQLDRGPSPHGRTNKLGAVSPVRDRGRHAHLAGSSKVGLKKTQPAKRGGVI